ncbi:hypothetical protein BH10PSE12_BH10PSE12_31160 [soil metagenome]
MRHRLIIPVVRPFDAEAMAMTILTEFGGAALTMARRLLALAEGEALANWQKIVMVLEDEAAALEAA